MLKSPFACKTLTFMKRYLNICVSGGKRRTCTKLDSVFFFSSLQKKKRVVLCCCRMWCVHGAELLSPPRVLSCLALASLSLPRLHFMIFHIDFLLFYFKIFKASSRSLRMSITNIWARNNTMDNLRYWSWSVCGMFVLSWVFSALFSLYCNAFRLSVHD